MNDGGKHQVNSKKWQLKAKQKTWKMKWKYKNEDFLHKLHEIQSETPTMGWKMMHIAQRSVRNE